MGTLETRWFQGKSAGACDQPHLNPLGSLNAQQEPQSLREQSTHPAVDDDHVLGVAVQPGLLGFTYGAHLVKRWCVQLGPAHIHDLQEREKGAASVSTSLTLLW